MTSGTKCTDSVNRIYNQMKVMKNEDDQNERPRLVRFNICNEPNSNLQCIDIEKIYLEKDLPETGKANFFELFLDQLKNDNCCYLLYDCHYETKESCTKKDLVFATWCPDNGPIKQKMVYASSKDSIKKTFNGVKHNLQFNSLDDCGTKEEFARTLCCDSSKLEGVPLK